MALVVLWPSWQLWKRMERPRSPYQLSRLHILPLGLAAFATAATSCPPIPNITRLVVENNTIYARSTWEGYFTSTNGLDWQYIWEDELSPSILNELQQEVSLPLTLCLPEDQNICYRITGEEQVEESLDGGYSWDVAWQIPFGRRSFMERKADGGLLGVCGKMLAPGPFDMVLIGGNGSRVLFASGNEGVLIRNEDGTFSRHGVLGAEPTPYAEFNPFLILGECLAALTLSLFILLIASYMGWKLLLDKVKICSESPVIRKRFIWLACGANVITPIIVNLILSLEFGSTTTLLIPILVAAPIITLWNVILRRCFQEGKIRALQKWLLVFVLSASIVGVSLIYALIEETFIGRGYLFIFYPNITILLVTMVSLTWTYVKSVFSLQIGRCMQRISWKAGFLCLIAAWFPFLIWTIGWIPYYELAIALAGISAIAVLLWARNNLRTAPGNGEISQ
jgi:hypothetical protein